MGTRRAIRGVLGNFLGTFTSRYSDVDGYWLFGFLVGELGELRIDLLALTDGEQGGPLSVAFQSATAKFKDQVQKAGLQCSQIREAWLTIRRMPNSVKGWVNGHACTGYDLSFSAGAVMDGGKQYEREHIALVAPHDAKVELRSARAGKPLGAPDSGGITSNRDNLFT